MKTLKAFIEEHREELKTAIERACPNNQYLKGDGADKEIRLWILNDEGLYNWARAEGVQI